VTPEQDALIRQAADLEDTTVTAFVLESVTSKAKRIVKQHQDLVLSTFESGNDELDGWLQRHALAAQHMDSARTFLLTRHDQVVGCFSLTMGSVRSWSMPSTRTRRGSTRATASSPRLSIRCASTAA